MKIKFTLFIMTLFIFSGCSEKKTQSSILNIKVSDWNGKETSLADYKGKYVVLDVWATWCGPCKEAVPVMERIKKDLDGKDFIFLGINTDSDQQTAAIRQSAASLGMTYPSLLDKNLEIATALGVQGIPAFFILSPEGNIIYRQDGLVYSDYPAIMAFIYKTIKD